LPSAIENQRAVLPICQLEKAETEMFHAKNSQIIAMTSKIQAKVTLNVSDDQTRKALEEFQKQ
jgi:hypothetical protein